ncbi:MAG: FMN-binding protein [Candidatus Dadabacteria bacterium]|nr:FMN-binding protein [Candidatus Dadabacteria bacterium]
MNKTAGFIVSSLLILTVVLIADNSSARVFLTKDEALKLAFADADTIEKESFFLKPEQIAAIEKLSKTKVSSRLFLFYIGKKDGREVGYAAIDTHTVRTKTQTIMVVVNPDGSLKYTEILAFFEPPEYKPTERWLDLFKGKKIGDGIKIGYDIPNISGATLSSNGTANAVKKVLAVFEVVIRGAGKD